MTLGRDRSIVFIFIINVLILNLIIANEKRDENILLSPSLKVLFLSPVQLDASKENDDDMRAAREKLWHDPKVLAAYRSLAQRSASQGGPPIQSGENEVCEAIQDDNYRPNLGINLNGSAVEVRQLPDEPQRFLAGYCRTETSSCTGLTRDDIIKSGCETRLRWHLALTRPYGSRGSWAIDQILIPYSCHCIYFVASSESSTPNEDFDWTFDD